MTVCDRRNTYRRVHQQHADQNRLEHRPHPARYRFAFAALENDGRQYDAAQHARAQHHANREPEQCVEGDVLLHLAGGALALLVAGRTGARAANARVVPAAGLHRVPLEAVERLVWHVEVEFAPAHVRGVRLDRIRRIVRN